MFRAGAEAEGFARVQASVRLPMFGGDCYAYGLLAMGFADLIVETSLAPYDFMALVPVIEGAGGRITDWQGRRARCCGSAGQVVASGDARVHAAACALLGLAASGLTGRRYPGRRRGTRLYPATSRCDREGTRFGVIEGLEHGCMRITRLPPASGAGLRAGMPVSRALAQPAHGVAMHGEPNYPPGFTHFDYVDPDAPKGGSLAWRRSAASTASIRTSSRARPPPGSAWCSRR